MDKFIVTSTAQRAAEVCQATLDARDYARIGQIIGEPGTGKSATTKWLAQKFDGVRIECWAGISAKSLLLEIAAGLGQRGIFINDTGTADTLFARIKDRCKDKLILVDEANHLNWKVLERLRALSDLGGCGLILSGTDILERRFKDPRIQVYLRQMTDRIGAKRISFAPIGNDEEIVAHVIQPRFGAVNKKTATRFRVVCKGYWRGALELGDACERLMKTQNLTTLTVEVVNTAGALMAGQRPKVEASS